MGDFKGVTFNAQNVTPKNDGGLYNAHSDDGILYGCEMSILGDDLIIQPGEFIQCGRVIEVDGATPISLSGRSIQTGYIQVIHNIDLSQGEGQQWYTTFVESATTTFPDLTKEDVNKPTGELNQLQLAIVQVSGGNLTTLTSSLLYAGLKVASPTAKGLIRPSASSGTIILSAENGNFAFRPHSWSNSADQMVLGTSGDLSVKGKITSEEEITADYPSGNPYIHLKVNGADKGQFYYQSSNGILAINNPATDGGRINIYDSGYLYINGKNNIYIRPNGSSSGEIYFDTDGQQHGGHPIKQVSDTSTQKSISNSTGWTNIASLTGLTNGTYIFYGKCTFAPTSSTNALISLCVSTSSNSSSASYNASCLTVSGFTVYPSICMLVNVTQSTMYLNIQANGIGGKASTWYFRAVRIN